MTGTSVFGRTKMYLLGTKLRLNFCIVVPIGSRTKETLDPETPEEGKWLVHAQMLRNSILQGS